MAKISISSKVTRQLTGLASRLRDNSDFMAYVLASYQKQEQLTDDALAQCLNTTPAMLSRLALCKRPVASSPQFADQIRQIASYTGVGVASLANMVRQVSSLEQLAEQLSLSHSGEKMDARPRQVQPGLLVAARDRGASEEDKDLTPGDEGSSEE